MGAGLKTHGGEITLNCEEALTKMFDLHGKICLITGGSGNLGIAIAIAYLKQGATLILASRNKNNAYIEIEEKYKKVSFYPVDVSDPRAVEGMVASIVEQYGRIDVLVTTAGIQHRSPVLDFSVIEWNRIIQTNLNGTFYCAQSAARRMVSQGKGRIVMLTSLTAEIGIAGISAYAASRGAIKQLCKTMAVELAANNVTVNCIGPGRIATAMTADLFNQPDQYKSTLSVIPMKRWGTPQDVTGAAVFLVSDEASYITGQTIYIDGGWLAGGGNIKG
jgi:gluconate 5-dehydrogenase